MIRNADKKNNVVCSVFFIAALLLLAVILRCLDELQMNAAADLFEGCSRVEIF